MKKILIISHEFPPSIGGAGSVAHTLWQSLKEKCDVTVLTKSVDNSQNISDGILKVKVLPVIFFIQYWLFIKIRLQIDQFDSIILNDIGASMVGSFFFPKSIRRKTVVYFHGNEREAIIERKGLKNILFNSLYIRLLKSCKALIFVSDFLKDKILSHPKLLDLGGKSNTIYSPLPHTLFYPTKSDFRLTMPELNGKKIMLTVCRIVKQKGLSDLAMILLGNTDLHWVLIGSGDYTESLTKEIRQLKLTDRFTYIPSVNRADLKYYYSGSDFFILLSNFEESFGLVYLEANACGIPVIGRDKGGVSEAILDGVSGYIVKNFQEALIRIKEIDLLAKKSIITHSQNFDLHKYSARVNKVLN